MSSLGDLFVTVGAKIDGFKAGMSDVSSTLDRTASTVVSKASSMSGKVTSLMAGISFAGISVGALAAANKFDEANVIMQRATGATEDKLKQLGESFTNVYRQTAVSSDQVAQTLALLSTRTNMSGKALEDLTLSMIKLSKTQREDVATITPLVTRAFGDWSIATDRQRAALDYFRVASQQSGTSVARLAEQVVYAGAPLRQLGFSFEQSTALIAKFDKEGVNTELVLGGMKAALQKFAKEGITDTAAAWQDFVKKVRDGQLTLGDVMKEVGAKRGVDLYKAITEGRFEIDKMVESTKELAEKGGASIETFRTKLTKWQHNVESLAASHQALIISLSFAATGMASLAGIIGRLGLGPLPAMVTNVSLALSTGLVPALTATEMALLGVAAALPILAGAALQGYAGTLSSDPSVVLAMAIGKYFGNKAIENAAKTPAKGNYGPTLAQAGLKPEDVAVTPEMEKIPEYLHYLSVDAAAQADILKDLASKWSVMKDAVKDFILASEPIGKKVQYDSAQLDAGAVAALQYANAVQVALDAIHSAPIAQLPVDWTKAGKGTALETIMGAGSSVDLRRRADAAAQEAERVRGMWQAGAATQQDYERAQRAATEAEQRASGITVQHTQQIGEFGREVRKAFDHMAKGIANSIVEWQGLGETALSVVKDLAKGIIEILVNKGLQALASKLIDVSGAMGKIFGSAAGGASSAAGAAGSATSAIGTAVKGITSTVTGVLGAIGSLGSMVSGIIGNFQMHGMNQTLDLIEKSTRYSEIYLGGNGEESIFGATKRTWQTISEFRDRFVDFTRQGIGVFNAAPDDWLRVVGKFDVALPAGAAASGGGNVYFQNCTFSGVTESLVDDIGNKIVRKVRTMDSARRF